MKSSKGFTIVELLVVIVIIAILAMLVFNGYSGVQAKARQSRTQEDIAQLQKAVILARESSASTLKQITGTGFTASPCMGLEPNSLPKTHACWTRYRQTIDSISSASGMSLSDLYDGTQYGQPYYIDENEGESVSNPCVKDRIIDRGQKFSTSEGIEVTKDLTWFITGC